MSLATEAHEQTVAAPWTNQDAFHAALLFAAPGRGDVYKTMEDLDVFTHIDPFTE